MENSPLISNSPPPLIRFRHPEAILSIPNTSSLIFGKKWENGSEDGFSSGHSEKLTSGKINRVIWLPFLYWKTMHGITCFADSMCSFRTWVASELFGSKMAIFLGAERKMEFNQYFSKAEKKNGNSSRTAFKYTPKWKTLPLFPVLFPSNSISRLPTRDSSHSRHVFPYILNRWEKGSEDGSTSGHSEKLKVSRFRDLFFFLP
ncbi:hypothetical protein CDAR_281501 [Caerostris darwini]|uniref:Uncharacterized protein n=1 Tax=Caerostris darwini TaxID=1538125 RepID=A0AAV4R1N9_9ARAC|nr:hypothetical protein CDAR_281501 [Caerostris darwini]